MNVASDADVLAMNAVVIDAVWGPSGIVSRLGAEAAAKVEATPIYVSSFPTADDRRIAGVPEPDPLLGLWSAPPDQIDLFATYIISEGYSPVDVVTHEIGHLVFDFPDIEEVPGCANCLRALPEPHHVWTDTCPVCQTHDHAAIARGLVEGLRTRAFLHHRIPEGAGGVIPGARHHLAIAQALAEKIAPMFSTAHDRAVLERLTHWLDEAQRSLAGWMTTTDLVRAQEACFMAWDASWDVNHSFWHRTTAMHATGAIVRVAA